MENQVKQQEINLLLKRVNNLEEIVGIQNEEEVEIKTPLFQKFQQIEENLNGKILRVQNKLDQRVRDIRKFIQKYEFDSTSVLMSSKSKAQVLLENQDEIINAVKNLEQIKSLQKFISFDPIQDINKKISDLRAFETMSMTEIEEQRIKQKSDEKKQLFETFLNQQNQTQNMIKLQNEIINSLNQKFLYLESLVTLMEQNNN
ncbi:hypothetical protein PPERSA_10343 [Pseudocohnilembus persalinus]|uniref:Uncharacterized protein n=1 Tax=Pseudocohnilembus persalinus TaxID=266149 RepID=A0A0V0R0B3_PSEPJ|nr:hypothetical protein PPERSA_10343 [Pseudocohnilembus persalinus]|eukprot:KRX07955.1 hypothetical protein PPERSA_10343 [Pseudocohnilembus persalinus]